MHLWRSNSSPDYYKHSLQYGKKQLMPELEECGMFPVEDAPFIAASPDYMQRKPELALLEIKCVRELPPKDSIPRHYYYQVL